MELKLEDLKKLHIQKNPLTKLLLVDMFDCTISEYEKWRAENDGKDILKRLDQLILNSFYQWGMDPKVKSAKVIDLYIENEIPKSNTGIKLEILNDINEIEKKLQPFDINNKPIEIENGRDQITIIPDEDGELIEDLDGPDA